MVNKLARHWTCLPHCIYHGGVWGHTDRCEETLASKVYMEGQNFHIEKRAHGTGLQTGAGIRRIEAKKPNKC